MIRLPPDRAFEFAESVPVEVAIDGMNDPLYVTFLEDVSRTYEWIPWITAALGLTTVMVAVLAWRASRRARGWLTAIALVSFLCFIVGSIASWRTHRMMTPRFAFTTMAVSAEDERRDVIWKTVGTIPPQIVSDGQGGVFAVVDGHVLHHGGTSAVGASLIREVVSFTLSHDQKRMLTWNGESAGPIRDLATGGTVSSSPYRLPGPVLLEAFDQGFLLIGERRVHQLSDDAELRLLYDDLSQPIRDAHGDGMMLWMLTGAERGCRDLHIRHLDKSVAEAVEFDGNGFCAHRIVGTSGDSAILIGTEGNDQKVVVYDHQTRSVRAYFDLGGMQAVMTGSMSPDKKVLAIAGVASTDDADVARVLLYDLGTYLPLPWGQ